MTATGRGSRQFEPAVPQEITQARVQIFFAMNQDRDPPPEIEIGGVYAPQQAAIQFGDNSGQRDAAQPRAREHSAFYRLYAA